MQSPTLLRLDRMGFRRSILILLVWCSIIRALNSSVCLNYLACYNELYMNYTELRIYHEDLEEDSVQSCGILCQSRHPEAPLVMAKLIPMNERLVCGCGDYGALGNHTGIMNSDFFCRNCPEGGRKCGGQICVSVYRRVLNDDVCDDESYDIPSLDLTPGKESSVTFTSSSLFPTTSKSHSDFTTNPVHRTTDISNITDYPYYTTTNSSSSTYRPTPISDTLFHLGCYDENNVNKGDLELHYLTWTETTVNECYGICQNSNFTLMVIGVVKDTELFCGCGYPNSLGRPMAKTICEQSRNEDQCQFNCTLYTYSAYLFNSAKLHGSLLSLIIFALLAHIHRTYL